MMKGSSLLLTVVPRARAIFLLLAVAHLSSGAIKDSDQGVTTEYVSLVLKPDSKHIHFIELRLEAPGYIDVADLKFSTVDTGHEASENTLEDVSALPEDDDAIVGLWDDDDDDQTLEDSTKKVTAVDVAVVFVPDDCPTIDDGHSPHCDFSEMGVGRKYSEFYGLLEEPYWCCTDKEVKLDICDGSVGYGRMMLNLTIFEGSHRIVEIPPYGKVTQTITHGGRIEEPEHSGKYAIVLSNCHAKAGREIVVQGNLIVKTSGGGPAQVNGALKSFAKKPGEMEDRKSGTNKDSSGLGVSLALLLLGVFGVAVVGWGDIRRLGPVITRGYNSLELSELDRNEAGEMSYMPISSSWQ